jgi:hypothetical protein
VQSQLISTGRRIGWLYPAVLLIVFLLAGVVGYVYSYAPVPDQLVTRIDRTAESSERIVSGTLIEVTDDRLVLDSAGQRIEIALASGTPVDELTRVTDPFAPDTQVNVGVEQTNFGLVLTGIVAVEAAP